MMGKENIKTKVESHKYKRGHEESRRWSCRVGGDEINGVVGKHEQREWVNGTDGTKFGFIIITQ